MTKKEKSLTQKHRKFYEALENGSRKPDSEAQLHFIKVCKGKTPAKTEHEFAYLKYRRIQVAKSEIIEEKKDNVPINEPGRPEPEEWYSNKAFKKNHPDRNQH